MKGAAEGRGAYEVARMALEAGCDLLLFAFHDELTEFVGGQDTPAGDHFTDLATSLLRGTVPTGDPYDDNWYRDPIVVAAHALGHEYAGNLAWRDGVLEAGICPRSADRRRED